MRSRHLWSTILVLTSLLFASGTLASAATLPTKATSAFKLTKVSVSPDPMISDTVKGTLIAHWTALRVKI